MTIRPYDLKELTMSALAQLDPTPEERMAWEVERCYEQRKAAIDGLVALEKREFYEEEATTDNVVLISAQRCLRGERRRTYRVRRRHHGSKVYVPEPETYLTTPNPRVAVSLPARAVLDVPAPVPEPAHSEVDYAVLREPAELGDPDDDPLDAVDPDILSLFEELDGAVELPPEFHVEYGGGPLSRADVIDRLQRGAQTEPDWGDPEGWDWGRYEPKSLIVRS